MHWKDGRQEGGPEDETIDSQHREEKLGTDIATIAGTNLSVCAAGGPVSAPTGPIVAREGK